MTDIGSILENLLSELTSESRFVVELEQHLGSAVLAERIGHPRLLDYAEGRMNGILTALNLLGAPPESVYECYAERPKPPPPGELARDALWDCLPDSFDIHDRALLSCWLSEAVLPALHKHGYLRAIPAEDGGID